MRGVWALGAAALAGLAAVISSQDDDGDLVPFFVGMMLLGAIAAWGIVGGKARVLDAVLVVWSVAAIWVAVLLIGFAGAASSPTPLPVDTYLGLPATAYHLLGLYGGLALLLVERWRVASATPDGRSNG
jgi:hypothetical protein